MGSSQPPVRMSIALIHSIHGACRKRVAGACQSAYFDLFCQEFGDIMRKPADAKGVECFGLSRPIFARGIAGGEFQKSGWKWGLFHDA